MSLLDQSGVTGGGLDPYNVHALFVNMDNMWMERFGNYDYLVCLLADLKNQPIGPLCVTHILKFCSYFKSQEQFSFNPIS